MNRKMEKVMEKIIITELVTEDLDRLVELHNIYLDYGPDVRPHFAKVLQNPENIALKCLISGDMVGALIYTKGVSFSTDAGHMKEKVLKITGNASVYTGDAVFVCREYRKQNLAGLLYEEAKRRIKQKGVRYVIHELWVHPDGTIPAIKVLNHYGPYYDLGLQKNFYEKFYQYGRICPICGINCKCAAEIYISEVDGVAGEKR